MTEQFITRSEVYPVRYAGTDAFAQWQVELTPQGVFLAHGQLGMTVHPWKKGKRDSVWRGQSDKDLDVVLATLTPVLVGRDALLPRLRRWSGWQAAPHPWPWVNVSRMSPAYLSSAAYGLTLRAEAAGLFGGPTPEASVTGYCTGEGEAEAKLMLGAVPGDVLPDLSAARYPPPPPEDVEQYAHCVKRWRESCRHIASARVEAWGLARHPALLALMDADLAAWFGAEALAARRAEGLRR